MKIEPIVGAENAFQYVSFFEERGIINVTECSQNILQLDTIDVSFRFFDSAIIIERG
ncbi:hypothetical protein [Bacillus licheniformis]|uniref:hypothetical protein n=1 Tax=Bacillus licheniformis TaxID=1402 RepID=UPI000A4C7E86